MSSLFPTFSRITRWRAWRLLAKAFLVLVILAGIAHIVLGLYWGGQVRKELRRIEAAGEPIALADINPPSVPLEENSFPIYMQAADALERHGIPPGSTGTPDDPYNDLDWTDPDTLALHAAAVLRDAPARELVREADTRPLFRSDLDYTLGIDADFTHLSRMRRIARFLATCAVQQSLAGDQSAALETLRLGFAMSRHPLDEPTFVNLLVACALDGVMSHASGFVFSRGDLDSHAAQRLADELSGPDYHLAAGRASEGERALCVWYFGLVRRNAAGDALDSTGPYADLIGWLYAYPLRPWSYADQLRYMHNVRAVTQCASVGPAERAELPAEVHAAARPEKPSSWFLITKIVSPIHHRVEQRVDGAVAIRDLTRAALGLELHRSKHDRYPASLTVLRESGWDVPTDIFTNHELVYSSTGDDFTLYSVGENAVDDGGKPITAYVRGKDRPKGDDIVDLDEGDIVWQGG